MAAGQAVTPTAVMRLAQIDVQLGQYDRALSRLGAVRSQGKGGATAEQLAVLTLEEKGQKAEARALLKTARGKYPRSCRAGRARGRAPGQGRQAGRGRRGPRAIPPPPSPRTPSLVLMRAQIQAENLKAPDRARELLKGIADRSDSSAPAGPARRARAGSRPARRGRGRRRPDPGALEGIRHRRRARRPARAEARQDGRGRRALQRRPQEGPEQQDRPVLEGPARRPERIGRRGRAGAGGHRPRQAGQGGRQPAPPCSPRRSRRWPASRSRPATSTRRSGGSRSSSGAAGPARSPAATAGS